MSNSNSSRMKKDEERIPLPSTKESLLLRRAGGGSYGSPKQQGGEEEEEDHSQQQQQQTVMKWGMGYLGVARGSLVHLKDRIIDKLAAVPVPTESLEDARHSIETIVREATVTAYSVTREAVQRIRLRLVDILPSLSSQQTREIVDDAEREVLSISHESGPSQQGNRAISAATASADMPSTFSPNLNKTRSWPFRARL